MQFAESLCIYNLTIVLILCYPYDAGFIQK